MPGLQHIDELLSRVFRVESIEEFKILAFEIFHYQRIHNKVYHDYINHLGVDVSEISRLEDIPFLPIGFFRNHQVISGDLQPEICFTSSGTSGIQASRHYVKDLSVYETSFTKGFNHFYGDPEDYCILALLPSYLERGDSSLVYMVDKLISFGNHPLSGFFLDEHSLLADRLKELNDNGTKTMLIGVAFALLDFVNEYPIKLHEHITVMETGGMKGRREEITREELHMELKNAFGLKQIHSEYGMTELLSQTYSRGNGKFSTPPWMMVLIRDIQDPFNYLPDGRSGAINIIDLANIHSCSFIETQDIGRLHSDGSFEVLGRTDHSDMRGCSLMIQ